MIKILVMDVDGTMTDGKIYMGCEGEILKAFSIKDGCGILFDLPKYGIIPVVITTRKSKILSLRCGELGITEMYQGVTDKLKVLKAVVNEYGVTLNSVAYAGDDLPDIPCMEAVKKEGGLVLCPCDAISEIKALADYVSGLKAGDGFLRDAINYLGVRFCKTNAKADSIKQIISWINSGDFLDTEDGEYLFNDGTKYTIQTYLTKNEKDCLIESHRNHIDIQYMINGSEYFNIYSSNCLTSTGCFDEQKDVEYWKDGIPEISSLLVPGSLIVVQHGQPHKGAISTNNNERVKKLVCKIKG